MNVELSEIIDGKEIILKRAAPVEGVVEGVGMIGSTVLMVYDSDLPPRKITFILNLEQNQFQELRSVFTKNGIKNKTYTYECLKP